MRQLESTGSADHGGLEGNMQRALDGIQTDLAAYTPADASLWAAPAPTTIAAAINRLAAKVKALAGAPIP